MQRNRSIRAKGNSIPKKWLLSALAAFFLVVTMLGRPAQAQIGQQFVGHVADASGASIAGATVTIHNEASGEDVVTKTTGAGEYTAPYLKPGIYTITVRQTGFKESSKTHITLSTDQSSKMDFTLPIGAITETVTVSSEGAQIELSKADRGEIIGNERVQEMPSDGRNYMVLFGLSPGTNNTSNPQYPRQQDNVSSNLHVSGVPQATVQENLDGGTNDTANGWAGSNVPMDTIAEFKVVLNPYDASYGRAGGGAVDVSLKSGTNKYHGSLYEFARRPYMDAQSYAYNYAKSHGSTASAPSRHKRDIFGLEVDGAVVIPHVYNGKDKTFFTAQWEQSYEAQPATGARVDSIPDPKWLTGDFSGAQYYNTTTNTLMPLIIYDPLAPTVSAVDPLDPANSKTLKNTRQPFQGNIIPKNRLDPVGLAIAQYYNQVTPNYNPGGQNAPFQNNHFYLPVETNLTRNGLFKLDQNFGARDRATIRWTGFERFDSSSPNGLPTSTPINNEFVQVQPKQQQYALDEIHTFSANFILDNKITVGTEKQGISSGTSGFDLTKLGFSPNFISNTFIKDRFPNVYGGYINLAPGGTSGASNAHNLGYQPSITLIHGRHTVRAGLDMRLYQYANVGNAQNNQFGFGTTFTSHFTDAYKDGPGIQSGNSIAELILGYPNGGSVKFNNNPFYSQHYYALWAQDDWKVTPKLTLNFGIRYDLLGARTERHNKMNYIFDTTSVNPLDSTLNGPNGRNGLNGPLIGGITFAGVNGNPRGAYKTNLLNIQPRFGAAYAFSSRTSLRAGFGEMFIQDEGNDSNNGYTPQTGITKSLDGNLTPALNHSCTPVVTVGCSSNTLADPYPFIVQPTGATLGLATTPGGGFGFNNPNYKVPSLWQFSVSLEQLLTKRDTLDISYSGLKGYNLSSSDNINHVSAAYNAQCDVERGGTSSLCNGVNLPSPFYQVPGFKGTGYQGPVISNSFTARPFQAFGDVNEDRLPLVHNWYNSLQVTLGHTVSQDLSLHVAYTWSKSMTAGELVDNVNRIYGRHIGNNDVPNAISFSAVYHAPFGRGKMFLGHTNRLVDAAIGGWEISPLYVYTQWYPWSPGSDFEILSPIAVRIHDLPVDGTHNYKRLQGASPCVGYKNQDTGVITPGPSYGPAGCSSFALVRNPGGYAVKHNIVYTGVRLPANHQFDVSVSKRFAWNERANLQLRLDAFNVLNHPNWTYGDNYHNDPTRDNFGMIDKGPDNPYGSLPRDLQISGKLTF